MIRVSYRSNQDGMKRILGTFPGMLPFHPHVGMHVRNDQQFVATIKHITFCIPDPQFDRECIPYPADVELYIEAGY